ncbi:SRPBCC domain-containing protein [Salana multivorans]
MASESPDEEITAQIHAPINVLLQQDGPEWTLVMRRTFPHAPERVWRMLTQPTLLARWSPVVPDRPLDEPGPATCRENPGDEAINAEVLIADPPRKLVHRWGPEVLEWTITADAEGSRLELRQALGDPGPASRYAAGWRVCLGRLAAEQEGVERERVVGERAWAYGCRELIEHYQRTLGAPDDDGATNGDKQ